MSVNEGIAVGGDVSIKNSGWSDDSGKRSAEFGRRSPSATVAVRRKVQRFHRRIMEDVENEALVPKTAEDIRKQYPDDRKYLLANGPKDTSLLHLLVEPDSDNSNDFEKRKPLIELLLSLDKSLLKYADSNGHTPLRLAANDGAGYIVQYLCELSDDAVESLGIASKDRSNSLHVAVQRGLDLPERIVQKLSKDILNQPDSEGNTALHIAATPPCKKLWVEILVRHASDSIQTKNKMELPPLRHLMKKREEDARAKIKQEKHRGDDPLVTDKGKAPHDGTPKVDGKPEINGVRRSDTSDFRQLENEIEADTEERNNESQREVDDEVQLALKLHSLRCSDRETARKLIYEPDEKLEIEFDLEGYGEITGTALEDMTHLKLDKFLQYVHIPNLHATWDGYRADVRNAVEAWRCPGRVDFCMIFDWLKRRSVEKILKIIVDDVGDDRRDAHSDQAIEHSVRDLGVEIWDWRKKDISSEVIYNTARDTVREVSLYCSGSNAVLRGWADTGGLVKLPKLEQVNLYVDQGLETEDRINTYQNDFETLLKASHHREVEKDNTRPREIKVERTPKGYGGSTAGNGTSDPRKSKGGEQGVEEECMDEFADFIRQYNADFGDAQGDAQEDAQRRAKKQKGKSPGQPRHEVNNPESAAVARPNPQVKVAVIDDGVQTSYQRLSCNIETGESFPTQPHPDGRHYAYINSTTGHGTVMACLIRRVCRNVRLYVAKLDTVSTSGTKIAFSPRSAAEAIEWAIAKDVDIISMSWTIDKARNDENNEDIKALGTAVRKAASKNILLFCAIRDRGADVKDNTYPKQFDSAHIFSIGAATREGGSWEKTGDDTTDFLLPGVQLIFPTKDHELPDEWNKYDGSSLACALASGLAALILYCAQAVGNKDSKKLKNYDGMKKAFLKIETSSSGYLFVWDVFRDKIKGAITPDQRKTALIEIANRLLSWTL